MKLQYVFGANPAPKRKMRKNSSATKKSVGARKNPRKIKKGGLMAKKKGSAAQRAHRKWFGEMARAGAFSKNPKAKKRRSARNAVIKQKWKRVKPRPTESVTVSYPDDAELAEVRAAEKAAREALEDYEKVYDSAYASPFKRKFLLPRQSKSVASKIKKAKSAEAKLSKLEDQLAKAKAQIQELESLSQRGEAWREDKAVLENKIENLKEEVKEAKAEMKRKPRRRSSGKGKKSKKNPKAPDYGMVTVGNPRKKPKKRKPKKAKKTKKAKRKSQRRSRRRSSAITLVKPVSHSRRRKWAGKKKGKLRARITLGNPMDLATAKPYLYAALGYVVLVGAYKVADHYSGGKVSAQIGTIVPPAAQPFVIPAIGMGLGYLAHRYASDIPVGYKGQKQLAELGKGAMLAGGVLAALAAVKVGIDFAKQQFPQVASMPVIGPMLSGVEYFPGMSGADFGNLGDGYRQSGADFGNVRFFPAGMQGVEYFPEGSRGDQMYVPTEAQQLREAQGLGVIPEGMGEIPEGLGNEDEGQMG